MTYKVSPADLTHIRLNETDTVAATLQRVAIILATWRGTSPLCRSIGLKRDFVDKPTPVARVMMLSDVKESIEGVEPTVTVKGVTFAPTTTPGQINPIVEVEINAEP